jgi:hypothetical protein
MARCIFARRSRILEEDPPFATPEVLPIADRIGRREGWGTRRRGLDKKQIPHTICAGARYVEYKKRVKALVPFVY